MNTLNPAKLKLSVTLPKLKFPLASLLQDPTTTVIQPLEVTPTLFANQPE
jgi:hypothetical protein